jgi:hypothetical protein
MSSATRARTGKFALLATAADPADGAALNVSSTRVGVGTEYSYTTVVGESYPSFQALYTSPDTDAADNLNLSAESRSLPFSCSLEETRHRSPRACGRDRRWAHE